MDAVLIVLLVLPFIGGIIAAILGKKNENWRDICSIVVMAVEFVIITALFSEVNKSTIHFIMPRIMGIGMYLKLDLLRYIFVWLSITIWLLATIYSTRYLIRYYNRNRYYLFFAWTLTAAIGFFMSENLVIQFTFFEMMTLTSYVLVIHDEDRFSHRAGISYLSMALAGGLVILLGIFMVYDYTGTLIISEARLRMSSVGDIRNVIATLLILGFSVKSAIFPVHVWLPEAHPAAPAPASAILSGVLIKTGLFGILMSVHMLLLSGEIIAYILMSFAMVTMFWGGFLAMFQRNIKRILAYSSMSQAGYILFGIGLACLGSDIKNTALLAVVTHMFNHSFFKVLLFMGAGVIYMLSHELSINAIWGFGRNKQLLKILVLIGTLSLVGFPGTSGYVSKTILHQALSIAHRKYHNGFFIIAQVVFFITSSITVAYMLKMFISIFVRKNSKPIKQHPYKFKFGSGGPMIVIAVFILFVGMSPSNILEIVNNGISSLCVRNVDISYIFEVHNIVMSVMIFVVGIGIYKIFIKGVLYGEVASRPVYINPSVSWISIEEDIYLAGVKKAYKFGYIFFRALDKWIGSSLSRTKNLIGRIANIEITHLLNLDIDEDCEVCETEVHRLGDVIHMIFHKASLMPYAMGLIVITFIMVALWMMYF